MAKLNWAIILYNIRDAREQLQKIEGCINDENPPSEIELQTDLEHALHHLFVAWNARRVSAKRYATLSDADFDAWSKFPAEFEI